MHTATSVAGHVTHPSRRLIKITLDTNACFLIVGLRQPSTGNSVYEYPSVSESSLSFINDANAKL